MPFTPHVTVSQQLRELLPLLQLPQLFLESEREREREEEEEGRKGGRERREGGEGGEGGRGGMKEGGRVFQRKCCHINDRV